MSPWACMASFSSTMNLGLMLSWMSEYLFPSLPSHYHTQPLSVNLSGFCPSLKLLQLQNKNFTTMIKPNIIRWRGEASRVCILQGLELKARPGFP